MILSMSRQASIFLLTVIIGLIIGFFYDWFRVFRRIISHKKLGLLIHIEDFLYWVTVSGFTFFVMLNNNYGEIRFFSIIGTFIGMILYFLTISRLFMLASITIINLIKKVLFVTIKIILAPFVLIYRLIKVPVKFLQKKIKNIVDSTKKVLHKYQKYARIRREKIKKQIKIISKKI